MRAPSCDPTATISAPSLATWPSVWLMPRPLAATVNWPPARVAGGNPSAAGGGAGPAGPPLLTPAITTAATPNTIMAMIGTAHPQRQPAEFEGGEELLNQVGLAGSGTNERSRRVHSVPASAGPHRGDRHRGGQPVVIGSW